ncbi:hypothetical protein ACFQ6N_35660 [Kitasatospora sp. NPDC056446]|uniref:hypothetical protein n=1 Tax=Kitasatospora sp. NPDC056446 TaxID=3345819 RepID=UPI003699B37C
MKSGGWKQWTAVVVVPAAAFGALGWALWNGGRAADQAPRDTGTPRPAAGTPGPPAPDLTALAASPEVAAADQGLAAEIDRRLAALLPVLSGAQQIGEGVQDGCGAAPGASDGSGPRRTAASCRRQVVKYLAVTGDPRQVRSHWEQAMAAQGAQQTDSNASPRPGEGLWYGFPRGDGDRDLLGVTLAFDERQDLRSSPTPGAGFPRTPDAPNAAATVWADRGSRAAPPVDQAAAQAVAAGRRLVVLSVDEEYFTGPDPR